MMIKAMFIFLICMPSLAFSSEKLCSSSENKWQFISEENLTEEQLLKSLEVLKENFSTINSAEQIKEIHKNLVIAQLYYMRKIGNLYSQEGAAELIEADLSRQELPNGDIFGQGFGLLVGIDGYCRAIGKNKKNGG